MKNRCILVVLFVFMGLAPLFVAAQSGVVRVEFPAELDKDPYEVVPLKEQGVLVFYAQDELLGDLDRNWHFIMYDTNLLIKWETDVPVLDGARYSKSYFDGKKVYLFFINTGKLKSLNNNYQISELDLGSGIIDHYKGFLANIEEVRGFFIMGDKAVIACNTTDEQAAVFFIDPPTQSIKAYRTDLPDQNFVEDLQRDPYSGSVLLLISNFLSHKQNRVVLLNIDLAGNLMGSNPIDPVLPSKYLNDARVYALSAGNRMVIGTYCNFAAKIPGKNDYYGIESAGFFSTRFEDNEQKFMNYYNFMELQNLRPAISARDYLKLARKKNRDETEYSADYELILHSIERVGDRCVIMAESYYPDFRTVSDVSYDYWGRPITHTYTVFEGYQIFQSMLLGFDFNGNLTWDNSLDMSNIKTDQITARARYLFEGKPAVLFYNDGIKISYRAFAENALVEDLNYTELETSHNGDKVVELGDNYINQWYDGKYLCFGYVTIRNNLIAKDKRTVFYINKVSFE